MNGTALRESILAGLYGPAAARRLSAEAEELLEARRRAERAPAWDERDAWLIAYPDQVTAPGEAPLRTLAGFLARYVDGHLNGVHVLPFHPSSSDEGFSVVDYDAVDPAYGTWDDLAQLASGRRLMVDAVVNHASVGGRWFAGFLAGDPEYSGFFRAAAPGADLSAVVRPRTHPLLTRFDSVAGPVWVWTTFSADQADLDYANPRVLLRMLEVVLDYARRGAAVIRLDAIAFLWKQEGTPSIHLPQTHAIVQFLRSCLDEVDPGIVLVTETNVPHAENVSYFGDGSAREAQAVYQFPLAPLVLDALLTGDASVLTSWAAGVRREVPGTTFLNFLASHDGVGVRPAEGLLDDERVGGLVAATQAAGGRVSERSLPGGGSAPYELNSTWFDLMAVGHGEADAVARHLASHAVVLALPGIPLLYVHSLFGSSNDRAGWERTQHNRSLNRARFALADLEGRLAEPSSRASRVWTALRNLLRLRASSPAFHPDASHAILEAPPALLAVQREGGGRSARVLVNVSAAPATAPGLGGPGWRDMRRGSAAPTDVRLGPWESTWLAAEGRE